MSILTTTQYTDQYGELQTSVTVNFRPWQREVLKNLSRFSVLVLHRRAGKTVFAALRLILEAMDPRYPNRLFCYAAPQANQVKKIAWDDPVCSIKLFAQALCPDAIIHNSEMAVVFPNGSRLFLTGVDDPHALRGIGLDGIVMDEVAQMPHYTWEEVVRKCLMDKLGWALFIGTPKGRDHFFELYENASKGLPDWKSFLYTVYDTQAIDPQEVANNKLEAETTGKISLFEQELLCSFEAAIQGAYYAKQLDAARAEKRITSVPYDSTYPVHTAWDLGFRDATGIWFFQIVGSEVRVLEYDEYTEMSIPDLVNMLKSKPYLVYGQHVAPHDIKQRELGTGLSRKSQFAKFGVHFQIAPKANVTEGINAVRAIFSRCVFDSRNCQSGLNHLSQYQEKIVNGLRTGRPDHNKSSHGADAFRYLALCADSVTATERFRSGGTIHYAEADVEWDLFG